MVVLTKAMYSGLFGDLPAAKGGSGQDNSTTSGGDGGGRDESKKDDGSNISKQKDFDGNQQQQRKRPLPNSQNDTTAVSSSSSKQSSFMQSIGTAGTSMAFVPSAALKKKKKQSLQLLHQKSQQSQSQKPLNDNGICNSSSHDDTKEIGAPIQNKEQSNDSTTGAISKSMVTMSSEISDNDTASNTMMTKTRQSSLSVMAPSLQGHREELQQKQQEQKKPDDNLVSTQHKEKDDDEEEEEEIMDPYDPYIPNDLLQYWEHQVAKLERIELQRQAEEARKTQHLIRERLEQERQKHHHLISSTQADVTVPSAAGLVATASNSRSMMITTEGNVSCDDRNGLGGLGRGRGRGRGVSNLPAWLVEKQRKEAQANLKGANR